MAIEIKENQDSPNEFNGIENGSDEKKNENEVEEGDKEVVADKDKSGKLHKGDHSIIQIVFF